MTVENFPRYAGKYDDNLEMEIWKISKRKSKTADENIPNFKCKQKVQKHFMFKYHEYYITLK